MTEVHTGCVCVSWCVYVCKGESGVKASPDISAGPPPWPCVGWGPGLSTSREVFGTRSPPQARGHP